jgi:Fe(3+) dicitrate transport protein
VTANALIELPGDVLLELDLVHTLTDSEFQETFLSVFSQWGTVTEGDELPYLPENVTQVTASLSKGSFSAAIAMKSRSQLRELPGTGTVTQLLHADALKRMDITTTWKFQQHWTAQIMIQNAIDEQVIVSHRPFGARSNRPIAYIGRLKYNL